MTPLPFPVAPEPDELSRERGRMLFAAETTFVKGVVAMDGLPDWRAGTALQRFAYVHLGDSLDQGVHHQRLCHG